MKNPEYNMPLITMNPAIRYFLDEGAVPPISQLLGDAGLDLHVIREHSRETRWGHTYYTFDTGVHVSAPPGIHFLLCLRSSMQKSGWYMSGGCPGVIDNSYRGSIRIVLSKISPDVPDMEFPARVCQIVPVSCGLSINTEKVATLEALGATERGQGGFGSTGTASPMPRRDNTDLGVYIPPLKDS
jgi:dUTP pyrophosphatase